ncbi:MAG TPA: Gfo/Idh/MocA family oxidoreductase [Nitrospiraceae bacterium]|nr:Gfo/Idh/MocA family oxidoreductase [Nitrospiraceae bacterium]
MAHDTDKTRVLRLGVIGAGDFAEACHIPGLQSHPLAKVVALCGRRYDHARAMADRLGVPDVHTDYRELCMREDLDAVTIATPNAAHSGPAMNAFTHGKHVFCEKPLATTLAEAKGMTDAAVASGNVHRMAFTFRYLYGVRELRRRLLKGDIGEPYYLRVQYDGWTGLRPDWKATWRDTRDAAGGGLFYDLGSHLFDLARFVLGPLETVTGYVHHIPRMAPDSRTGRLTAVETDDLAAAWFRHRSGVRGQWFISRITPPYTDNGQLEVIGPEGALKASLSRGKLDVLKVSRPTAPEWEALPLPDSAQDGTPHALPLMMRSFVTACLRAGHHEYDEMDETDEMNAHDEIHPSFHDGLAAQEALEAFAASTKAPAWVPVSAEEPLSSHCTSEGHHDDIRPTQQSAPHL